MKYFISLFFLPFLVFSEDNLEYVSCYEEYNSSCEVILEKGAESEVNDYPVYLKERVTGNKIFLSPEQNTTMEGVSLYRIDNSYLLLKEYWGAGRGVNFIRFKFKDHSLDDAVVFNIESQIDVYLKKRNWGGYYCDYSSGTSFDNSLPPLHSIFLANCKKKNKFNLINNDYINNDVIFFISHLSDNNKTNLIKLIALDSKDSNNIDVEDVGCIENCSDISKSGNFIGKINKKIRVKLHLDFKASDTYGYYYYDKFKQNINLSGRLNNGELILNAYKENGELLEVFNGILSDGKYSGYWIDMKTKKKYPFSFYRMITQ
ncbi:hypothetical protein [Pragia fontium]|uniref:Uncharacterized protein n=1 Tax=Pragia fontium DSM 5563 = ATCC 49100 TaxID=1122977 RepID=A0AAJ4WBP1_9GAMM|nr:hypothetical protein [Pragia fontium]SFD05251.1 hypothetical protein SAMN02745723_10788 [Pragia fontium DSM 5563 = ATCC 49100]